MNSKLEIMVDGIKKKYDILLKVETKNETGSYILYTDNEKNEVGDTIVYAGKLLENDDDEFIIKPVIDKEKLALLDDLLKQITKRTKKGE